MREALYHAVASVDSVASERGDCAGVSVAVMGVLHTSLPGTLVMMICAGFFLEVRSNTSSRLPVCVTALELIQGIIWAELVNCSPASRIHLCCQGSKGCASFHCSRDLAVALYGLGTPSLHTRGMQLNHPLPCLQNNSFHVLKRLRHCPFQDKKWQYFM